MSYVRQEALDYHAYPLPGKIAIALTKPAETAKDLTLAYSPGVAEPVRQQVAVARGAGSRIRSASRGEQYAGGRHPFRVVSGRA